ncbi:hypothetical protein DL767_003265 [Monosporascus sp. MG133]|nr:hypothetical protein DL767_003265 [Monosporascus sp. MG133]
MQPIDLRLIGVIPGTREHPPAFNGGPNLLRLRLHHQLFLRSPENDCSETSTSSTGSCRNVSKAGASSRRFLEPEVQQPGVGPAPAGLATPRRNSRSAAPSYVRALQAAPGQARQRVVLGGARPLQRPGLARARELYIASRAVVLVQLEVVDEAEGREEARQALGLLSSLGRHRRTLV